MRFSYALLILHVLLLQPSVLSASCPEPVVVCSGTISCGGAVPYLNYWCGHSVTSVPMIRIPPTRWCGTIPATCGLNIPDCNSHHYVISCLPILDSCHLELVHPNGGDVWNCGSTQAIVWTSRNLAGNVSIQIDRSYPSFQWDSIGTVSVLQDSFSWTVIPPATNSARIRIIPDAYPELADMSDSSFQITPPSNLTVLSPNGGEILVKDSEYIVAWISYLVSGAVRIELCRNYPLGQWELISNNVPNTGQFSWTVSSPPSISARIRILSVNEPLVGDTSNGSFQIAQPSPIIWHDPLDDQHSDSVVVVASVVDDTTGVLNWICYAKAGDVTCDSAMLLPTGNINEYAVTIRDLSQGSYDYKIFARDYYGSLDSTALWRFDVGEMCGVELSYDDGTAEQYSFDIGDNYFNLRAVKFGPVTVPYFLCGARVSISKDIPDSSHLPFVIDVYRSDGSGGMPGSLVVENTTGSIGNSIGGLPLGTLWADVILNDGSGGPIMLNSPYFYIAASNLSEDQVEAFGIDSGFQHHRSFFYDADLDRWICEDDTISSPHAHPGNRMIHALGYTLLSPEIVIRTSGEDILLNWNTTGASCYKVYRAFAVSEASMTLIGTTKSNCYTDTAAMTTESMRYYVVTSSTTP